MKSNTFSLRSCAAVGILAGVFAAPTAFADESFHPYVGVGAQVLNLKLEKAYGGPLFSKGVSGSTAFVGARVGEFMGIELGYNYFSRKRDTILGANDIFPGTDETLFGLFADSFIKYRTRVVIKDVNLAVTGYLPLREVSCLLDKTEVFAALGLSRTSVKLRLLEIATPRGDVAEGLGNPNHKFSQKKTVPIARIGVQQNITENINVSLFSEWKRLKGFKMRTPTNTDFEFRLKNSVSYGLRLGYIFK